MAAYYNEIDHYAAEWLRNLIKAGHIADGEVDTRSIVDVQPDDLRSFTQCHFFAGIAGWSHALRLAGWSDDRKIWTGSCPCQPFSVAGQGKGVNDERHLWPHFFRLIRGCRPPVVMGEQVAGAAGYGWLDGVRSDLESEDYAIEGVDIAACSANAPHIRQRLYWAAKDMGVANSGGRQERQSAATGMGHGHTIVAGSGDSRINNMGDTQSKGLEGHTGELKNGDQSRRVNTQQDGQSVRPGSGYGNDMAVTDINGHDGARRDAAVESGNGKNDGISVGSGSDVCPDPDMANANSRGCVETGERGTLDTIHPRELYDGMSAAERDPCSNDMADTKCQGEGRRGILRSSEGVEQMGSRAPAQSFGSCADNINMADAKDNRLQNWQDRGRGEERSGTKGLVERIKCYRADESQNMADGASEGLEGAARASSQRWGNGSSSNSHWDNAIWLNGADGKTRRAQPDICLLAHGVPARVGKLRAYGNAIVPPLAAEVIKAFMEMNDV